MRAEPLDRGFARRILWQVRDRHATGSEGEGCRQLGQLVGPRCELERAAADVEQQDLSGGPAEPAAHGEEGEARLGLAAEHLQGLAEGRLDPGDDLRPVGGFADGRGRRREELVDVLGRCLLRASRGGALERADTLLGDRAVLRRGTA